MKAITFVLQILLLPFSQLLPGRDVTIVHSCPTDARSLLDLFRELRAPQVIEASAGFSLDTPKRCHEDHDRIETIENCQSTRR
ncbi:Hypothetical protein NTJ_15664 [Nesidiocoris tenuis]|uniref:Uncharacterized protein n=1 Tax=Nesidiocoris tenuis TaxID=355587 RepID=A0ABN7BG31_9HEMI|nr:Hypothetical protein NTJ_15664 [Nesidiocoris tenuis]